MAASSYYSTVQKAYIAFYGRPADKAGLDYWAARIDAAGGNISSIIQAFGTSAEATALYGSLSNAVAVNTLYQQIFGRDADVTGLNFYVGKLLDGSYTLVNIAQRIIDGASGSDATIVTNKLAQAQAFTDAIDTAGEVIGYAGDAAASLARAWLATVSSTTASVTASSATLATTLTDIVATGGGSTGTTYALTRDADVVSGTVNNDTITAVLGGSSSTLTAGDIIAGGAGVDTLALTAVGTSVDSIGAVTMSGVEKVTLNLVADSDANAAAWAGVSSIAVTGALGKSLLVTNVDIGTTIDITGDQDVEINYETLTGSADAATVILRNTGSAGAGNIVDIGSATNALESATFNLVGANTTTIEGGASATTYTFTGAGSISATTNDTITTLDASALSGTNTFVLSGTSNVAAAGGSGNDTFTFGTTLTSSDSVDGNGGTDVVKGTVGVATLKLGQFTEVETATISFSGSTGTIEGSAGTVTTLNLASGATTDVTVNNLNNGVALNIQANLASAITVDYSAGATADINLNDSASVTLTALTVTDATTVDLSAGVAGTQTITTLTADATDTTALIITAAGSAALVATGAVAGDSVSTVSISTAASGSIDLQSTLIAAASSLTSITLNAAADSSLLAGTTVGNATAIKEQSFTLDVTTGKSASLQLDSIAGTSSSYAVDITLGASSTFYDYAANASGMTLTDGASGVVTSFTVDAAVGSIAQIGTITMGASGSIATLNVTGAASSQVEFDELSAGSLAGIAITTAGSATIDKVAVSAVGDITLAGGGNFLITDISATTVGDISITASGATISELSGTTVGDITVAGSGAFSITTDATTVGEVIATGIADSGSFTLNLSGVTNGVTVTVGGATNTIHSGAGNDVITLKASSGTDTIIYSGTGQAQDEITNFETGSAGDVLSFASGIGNTIFGAFYSGQAAAGSGAQLVQSVSAAVDVASTTDVIVLASGTFSNTAELLAAIGSGGALELGAVDELNNTGNDLTVVWSDGTNSYVSLVNLATGRATTLSLIDDDIAVSNVMTIATLVGVKVNDGTTTIGDAFDMD